MNTPNIRISITGQAGSGKTQLALLIKDVLCAYDIHTQLHEVCEHEIPGNIMRDNRDDVFEGISKRLNGATIDIDMSQGLRDDDYTSQINHPVEVVHYIEPTLSEIIRDANVYDVGLCDATKVYTKREAHVASLVVYDTGNNAIVAKTRYSDDITKQILVAKGLYDYDYIIIN